MLTAPARDRAYGVYGLLVGRTRLVAVLSPKVARGAIGQVQAFGDRPQVCEVVPAKGAGRSVAPLWRAFGLRGTTARTRLNAPIWT